MDINLLKEFLVLSENRNFTETSSLLNISQSSLSRHIKQLEDELEVSLFDRTSRVVSLNEYGEIFLSYAEKMAALEKKCTREIRETREKNKTAVTIATIYFINDLLAKFHHYNSSIAITSIHFGKSTEELTEMLFSGLCELAFIIDFEGDRDLFEAIPYETDTYAAILPLSHRLAKRDSIELNELSDDDFVSFNENSYNDDCINHLCRREGFQPKIVFRADVGSSIASLVRERMGISVLQKKTITKMNPSGIRIVDIYPEKRLEVALCYNKYSRLSPSSECFISYVKNIWPRVK